jgi:hypothetical protein
MINANARRAAGSSRIRLFARADALTGTMTVHGRDEG